MAVHIRSRTLPSGERRHDVQYRRGGRGYKLEHAGTFRTMKEAVIRRNLVGEWLAAGLDPKRELARLTRPTTSVLRLEPLAEQWLASRVDLDESTVTNYRSHVRRVTKAFGNVAVDDISPAAVNEWIAGMIADGLKPGTVKGYVGQLRMILDVLDENPARHRSVRLPKEVRTIKEPPDADEFLELLAALKPKYRQAAVLMEQTGMRVSESLAMRESDVDRQGLRVRVRPEVAKKDRPRWIPVLPWYMEALEPLPQMHRSSVEGAMHAVGRVNPHLLRHRRATLWHQQGIVATELAARLGHSRVSESLDTYSHVMPISEAHPSRLLEMLGK